MEFTEKNVINSIRKVVKWKLLGVQLDFKVYQLDTIEANHHNDVEKAKIALIAQWINNDLSASWKKLAKALRDAEHEKLADEIYQTYVTGTFLTLYL